MDYNISNIVTTRLRPRLTPVEKEEQSVSV